MSEQTKTLKVDFKSAHDRILETEALDMIAIITVTVGTGDEAVKFPVHETLLRKSSRFFDNAVKSEWADAREDPRDVDLSDECPDVFKVYLHWLYFEKFPTVLVKDEGSKTSESTTLRKCYVMGEQILDVGSKNPVLDALVDAVENQLFCQVNYPGKASIRTIYTGTLEGSPARRLLIDMWVNGADEDWINFLTYKLPHAFVLDFSKALLKSRCNGEQDTIDRRRKVKKYHEL